MSSAAITSVLGVLRRFKKTEGLSLQHNAINFIQAWSGDHTPSTVLRMAVAIQEQIEIARVAVSTSQLSEEAKEGLLATLGGLASAFSLGGMQTNMQAYVPALDSAITNFAIIASMADAAFTSEAKAEIDSLIAEIDELRGSLGEYALADPLREVLARQLGAISALLRNADAVGVEPALAAYFELLWQLRKAKDHETASEQSGSKPGLWDRVSAWSDRFTKAADLVDAGSKLLPVIEKAPHLLSFFG